MLRLSKPLPENVPDSLRAGALVPDRVFDAIYSARSRAVSQSFWTPVAVAQEAATLLVEAGARRVLDVGSGVGKFAIVASLATDLEVLGVEHRETLVTEAIRAATAYEANARFLHGSIASVSSRSFDGFYLYNPFGENLVHRTKRLDAGVRLGPQRYARDVERVEGWLWKAPIGTAFVTYNGFGGRIPASFELVTSRKAGECQLRLWRKRQMSCEIDDFFVELKGATLASVRASPAVGETSLPG